MPNGLVDGAVIAETGLDNSGFVKDARQFKTMLAGLKQTVQKVGEGMAKAGNAYLQSVAKQQKAGKALSSELGQVQTRVTEINKQIEMLKRGGITDENRGQLKTLEDELKQNVKRLNELHRASKETKTVANGFDHITRAAERSAPAMAKIAHTGVLAFLRRFTATIKAVAKPVMKLARGAVKALGNGLKKLGTLAGHAARSMIGIGKDRKSVV